MLLLMWYIYSQSHRRLYFFKLLNLTVSFYDIYCSQCAELFSCISNLSPNCWPIVYSDNYNIQHQGMESLHCFDTTKYRNIFNFLRGQQLCIYSAPISMLEDTKINWHRNVDAVDFCYSSLQYEWTSLFSMWHG